MIEKRLKYINDFFNNRISNIIKKLEKDYNINEFDTIKVDAITNYDLYGFATDASTNTRTYNNVAALKTSTATTAST